MSTNLDVFYDIKWKETESKRVKVRAVRGPYSGMLAGILIYLNDEVFIEWTSEELNYIYESDVSPFEYEYMCSEIANILNLAILDVKQKILVYCHD